MPTFAVVLVFDPTWDVLSLRRGPTDPADPGKWNFPGGRVERDHETVQQGAVRELSEEAGIDLQVGKLKWAFSFLQPYGITNVMWIRLPRRPKVVLRDGEHDRYHWSPLRRILQPTTSGVRYIVEYVTKSTWNLAPVAPDDMAAMPKARKNPPGGAMYARWPQFLPFPQPLGRRPNIPVPNAQSVDWPQAQWAPLCFPPGSGSVQPYNLWPDGPWYKIPAKVLHVDMVERPKKFEESWLEVKKSPALVERAAANRGRKRKKASLHLKRNPCGCGCAGDCSSNLGGIDFGSETTKNIVGTAGLLAFGMALGYATRR